MTNGTDQVPIRQSKRAKARMMSAMRQMLVIVACAWLFTGQAWADGNRARLALAPNIVATASEGGQLRMLPIATPVNMERPGDRQKERLRRSKLLRTLGIAGVTGIAAVLGGVLAGPVYGTAAGGAVLIIYLILP